MVAGEEQGGVFGGGESVIDVWSMDFRNAK
jgi:hypothetical protein